MTILMTLRPFSYTTLKKNQVIIETRTVFLEHPPPALTCKHSQDHGWSSCAFPPPCPACKGPVEQLLNTRGRDGSTKLRKLQNSTTAHHLPVCQWEQCLNMPQRSSKISFWMPRVLSREHHPSILTPVQWSRTKSLPHKNNINNISAPFSSNRQQSLYLTIEHLKLFYGKTFAFLDASTGIPHILYLAETSVTQYIYIFFI